MRPSPAPPDALVARGIVKRFPGVLALDRVDFDARRGEVVALVGENGAGKSTLLRCLAGLTAPDAGEMSLFGAPYRPSSVARAGRAGVALVHQELCLAENLSAAENIGLGREPRRFGLTLQRELRERADAALARVGARFGPGVRVDRLAAGERQLVEIAKGIDQRAEVLILDEPTSSLTAREAARLFELVRQLASEGITVVYVSHRLPEVLELADRAFVLCDGRNAGELARTELSRDRLVRAMVGRDVVATLERPERVHGEQNASPRLSLRGFTTEAFPAAALDLDVAAGEIVGIAGLVGSGRTELLETVFGLRRRVGGELRIDGAPVHARGPREAIAAGLGFVPEDRKEQGLLLEESVRANLALATLERRSRFGLVDRAAERGLASALIADLQIRATGPAQPVATLSGGNQQKVVVGRWLAARPRVLLLDEPTRGVDVGARDELYRLLARAASEGLAVLFASSDLEELLGVADRIVVLHEGRASGTLARGEATEAAILELATGGDGTAGARAGREGSRA